MIRSGLQVLSNVLTDFITFHYWVHARIATDNRFIKKLNIWADVTVFQNVWLIM